MTYTLTRKVLIRERELKKLKRQALVKSEYGNKNLYDSIEWQPVTTKDLLIEILKGNNNIDPKRIRSYMLDHTHSMY